MSLNLTGIDPFSPSPRIAREFRFAQGPSTGSGNGRPILLVGNKLSGGSEAVETIGEPIANEADCYLRTGQRSEIAWMYRAAIQADPTATYYFCAVAENGSATASDVTFTFATTATAATNIIIESMGETLTVGVSTGDTAIVQAAAVALKITQNPDLPFSAAQQAPANDHKVKLTCVGLGPRGDYIMNRVRIRYSTSAGTTVAKGAVTAGTGADDVTLACSSAIAMKEFFYHAISQTAVTTVTASDNGLGEYIDFIRAQAAPSVGKQQLVCAGLDCAQSLRTAVGVSSASNSAYAILVGVENNDWMPWMIAAHVVAAKRLQEMRYAGASLAGYTNSDTTPFKIPAPYSAGDAPTETEIAADLNNGITAIRFTPQGAAVIVRQICAYNYVPGTSAKDYRTREGHIPSVIFYAWEELKRRWMVIKQSNVTEDQPAGAKPLKGFNTPKTMRDLVNSVIDDLSGNNCPSDNTAILDPAAVPAMKASVFVETRPGGFGVSVNWQPVRHDLFDDFLILQGGPGY